eukprot:scaffold57540_cov75-Attheya_sp.AAC.3
MESKNITLDRSKKNVQIVTQLGECFVPGIRQDDDDDDEGNNNDDPKKRQMHDECTSDELGPVVLHDKIYSLETLPSVIEWCARGGNGGHGANGDDCGDVAIGVKGVNASAAHEVMRALVLDSAEAMGATEERPQAVENKMSDQANQIGNGNEKRMVCVIY